MNNSRINLSFVFCDVFEKEVADYFLELKKQGVIKEVRSSFEYNPLLESKYEYDIAIICPSVDKSIDSFVNFLHKQNKKFIGFVSHNNLGFIFNTKFKVFGKCAPYYTITNLEVEDSGCTDFESKIKNKLLVVDSIESIPEDCYDFILVDFGCLDGLCKNCFEIITVVNDKVIIKRK